MLQILVQFAGTYLRECPGNKVLLNLIIFLFSFVEMFQCSFNFKSSVKFFSAEFSVKFSFSCLTWKNFSCQLSFDFGFISWEASCLFKIFISYSRSDKTHPLAIFSYLQFCPRICTFIWFWLYSLGSFSLFRIFIGYSGSEWWNPSGGYFFF